MKTTIGGDRLGSGNKQNISLRNYERSTHDLSYLWRSTMSSGTLVPFLSVPALPGDSFDINLRCHVLTLPTIGPLFGSFKVQLDVFQVPMRIYIASLHMNRVGIGMDMSNVPLPQVRVRTRDYSVLAPTEFEDDPLDDNAQINASCLFSYLGIRGIGKLEGENAVPSRDFNAIPLLGYWDIYKNYYANKQEERGFAIHATTNQQTLLQVDVYVDGDLQPINIMSGFWDPPAGDNNITLVFHFAFNANQPPVGALLLEIESVEDPVVDTLPNAIWSQAEKTWTYQGIWNQSGSDTWHVNAQAPGAENPAVGIPNLEEFPLENIDDMRFSILQHTPQTDPFVITSLSPAPYSYGLLGVGTSPNNRLSCMFSQEALAIKTYQSDLFNNWIATEWIDGPNGVNAVTAVDTTGDSFTIDALNLAQKVYVMLNRIAISGGTYDDWLDAVYTHERSKSIESPMYMGSLIKELSFEEVVSNSASDVGGTQPLGQLAGRGQLTDKNKGGNIKIKVDEPSYIIGLVSLTPRIDYSQGNNWDVNLKTMNDWHKPALDAIGYQDLITEQMAWQSTELDTDTGDLTQRSAGKLPAWINYMTAVNKCYGGFAEENNSMFMTLNRRYEINETTGEIDDLTTYIDPSKFNHIFAETQLDAQNFWVQISNNMIARRKMSAKVIPNL